MDPQPVPLQAALRRDLTASIRARDGVRASTLRMALTAIATAEVAGKEHRELSEEETLAVLTKEAKKRKEAAHAYRQAGRPELAAAEDAEWEVLQAYLPAQLEDAELDRLALDVVRRLGVSGMSQMGPVMKVLQPEVAGRADGARVAAAARRALGS